MAKMTVQDLHNEIAAVLGKLSDLFVPGMKLSFIARMPGNSEADVLVGDDNEPEEMIALINRRLGALSSAPTAGSIDTPEFLDLVCEFAEQSSCEEFDKAAYDKARSALIAHIDTWAGRSAGERERELCAKMGAMQAQIDQLTAERSAGDAVPEALNTMLWLYRRLPRAYGRPPFVERDIAALAKITGTDIGDSFTERGAAPAPGNTAQPTPGKEE